MKAAELMIGDWVTILRSRENGSDRNVRINGIGKDCILAPGMYQNETGCYPYDYEHIVPVPLTAEILERNGFHTNYDHTLLGSCIYRRMYGKYDDYEVAVRMLNGWVKIKSYDDREIDILTIDIQPRFVHQLQHALRLCGLNELADNFKV